MRSRTLLTGSALFVALGATATGAAAAPALRFQTAQRGDFALIGNTLGYECGPGTPMPIAGMVGACGSNVDDTSPDIFWRADAPTTGQATADAAITPAEARSTAVLALPAGATITQAYLYWGARRAVASADLTATLEREAVFSANVTAIDSWLVDFGGNELYQSVADVTSLVSTHGAGAYRVSGVESSNFVGSLNDSHYAGWWLAVFYQLDTDPLRSLALFDGLDSVTFMTPQDVTLSGFFVPNAPYDARLGVVAYEGDDSVTGDALAVNGTAKTNMHNPADNFFNGTRSLLGAPDHRPGDLPELTGTAQSMAGIDIDVIDIQADINPGDTSALIQATTFSDQYFLGGFVTSISTDKPDYGASSKTAVDTDGGTLLPGDEIQYTVAVTNTGNDTSIDTVLNDALPMGVTFVAGSIEVTAGPNAGMKTDAAGDDQGEYTAATRTVTVRLGSGAGPTQGGSLSPGASTTVVFRVTVDAGFIGVLSNQAVITAGGLMGSPPEDDMTDGNGNGPGNPPTDVLVEQCATDADCTAPTPACDTVPAPNVCVECAADSHCGGLMPTCDVAAHVCICVPAGPEQCDGLDNDCNGSVDEGLTNCICQTDSDCGGPNSAMVCHDMMKICVEGCRGTGGNGCPDPLACTSTDSTIGMCIDTGSGSGGAGGSGAGGGGSGAGQGGSTATPPAHVQGGCDCRTQPEGDTKPAWLWLLAAGAALCRRRRMP